MVIGIDIVSVVLVLVAVVATAAVLCGRAKREPVVESFGMSFVNESFAPHASQSQDGEMYDEIASRVAANATYEVIAGATPPPTRAAVPQAVQLARGSSTTVSDADSNLSRVAPNAAYAAPEAADAELFAAANPPTRSKVACEATAFTANPAFEAGSLTTSRAAPTAMYVDTGTAGVCTSLDVMAMRALARQIRVQLRPRCRVSRAVNNQFNYPGS